MIVFIRNVTNEFGGSDLSMYLDRQGPFNIDASIGQRMDTLLATFFDPARILAIPDRAEIIIYDANVDQRWRRPNPNLLPDASADFETGVGGWVSNNANTSAARSLTTAAHGVASLALTSSANGALAALSGAVVANYATVTPGANYTAIASFRSGATARTASLQIDWLDVNGVLLSSSTAATGADSSSAWLALQSNGIAPTNASYARVSVGYTGIVGVETHFVDMVMLAVALPANAAPLWQISNYPVVDPPAIPPFGPPSLWTTRLFGGYCSSANYAVTAGTQRVLTVHAQDYTIRNKTTVCNKAYGIDGTHPSGWTDDQVVKDLYATYRPDIDTSNVQTAFANPGATFMPPISFPTHSLEQMLTRVQKISGAWYRVDYYKRLFYGGVGTAPGSQAPFAVNNDVPSPIVPTNLLTKDNSDFEGNGIGTWSLFKSAGQLFQTSVIAKSGTKSMQFTGNVNSAAGGNPGQAEFDSAPFIPGTPTNSLVGNLVSCTPGQVYSASIATRAATVTRPWLLTVAFTDASGNVISQTLGVPTINSTAAWTVITNANVTAPTNAAYIALDVSTAGTDGVNPTPVPNGEVHYFDEAQIVVGSWAITPPTVISYADTAWNTGAASKTLTISWQAGDVIVYAAACDANDVLAIPTAAGLTFRSERSNTAASTAGTQLAFAVAPAAGTSVVLTGTDTTTSTNHWGFAVWVVRGSPGIGRTAEQHTSAQTVAFFTTAAHSAVLWADFDFAGAASTGVSPTPTPTTVRRALADPTFMTTYAQELADQASTATINYGTTGGGAGPWSILVQEIPGTPTPVAWSAGGVPSFGAEGLTYNPDWSGLFDRIWVIGGQMTGNQTPAQPLTPAAGTYSGQQVFSLPAQVNNIQDASTIVTITAPGPVVTTYTGGVYVSGVIQIGSLGKDGTLDNLANANSPVLIGSTSPFTLALKTAPPTGSQVTIRAKFRYPLTSVYTDPAMLAALGGDVFEKVLRDRRIADLGLAQQVAKQNIAAEGSTKKGGQLVVDQRGVGGNLLQPGQYIRITSSALFTNLLPGGAVSGSFLITGLQTSLTEDTVTPYLVTISYSDRQEATDDDIIDLAIGEQGRINAALDAGDVNDTIQDLQTIIDTIGAGTEVVTVTSTSPHPALYDAATSIAGLFSYS